VRFVDQDAAATALLDLQKRGYCEIIAEDGRKQAVAEIMSSLKSAA